MKWYILSVLLIGVVFVECNHLFMGTNVRRQLLYNQDVKFSANGNGVRTEYFNYTMPTTSDYYGKSIQGILAYEKLKSGALVNMTAGGVGANFVKLRIQSEFGKPVQYDVYVYA